MPQTRTITIEPVTRLEGHARVEIVLGDNGDVDRAWLEIPEFRGFEKFCEGRPAEDMPQLTSRICGVCPTAHHIASTKALDALYHVEPPPAAIKIRELIYSAFIAEDHTLHFYFLGGPDLLMGAGAQPGARNVLGVIHKVGVETGERVIRMRRMLREVTATAGGKAVHPVFGLPGGVARRIEPAERESFHAVADQAVDFARFTLDLFENAVLKNGGGALMRAEDYTHRTYYMGMVDAANRVAFYDGTLRVVSPEGEEYARFQASDYERYIGEHVEPWTFMKFCFLKPLGWTGLREGADSSVFCVAPLARLNAAAGMPTPLAQQEYERFFAAFGARPVHHTLATHWARLIELLCAAERMKELAADPEVSSADIRRVPDARPTEGVGVVEAPRGTLIHHYQTDGHGLIRKANLIVATQNNAARIALSVEKAARALIKSESREESALNQVEMAVRAYDPCFGCATHALPGGMPLLVEVRDPGGTVVRTVRRD